MTALGIDYAWERPDPAAIGAAGYVFVCRYLSRDPSKNLALAEAQALARHGVWVVSNYEYGAQDMLRGYAGGIADAQLALAQATAAGMPTGRPIYFSADWDVTPAQEAMVLAYLSGAASVLGGSETGEYGGYYPVKTARDHGTAWTWQTAAWSGGQWDARDTLRQTGTATVGGVQVDVNEAMVADYGQWQPGRLPVIEGADMPLTDADVQKILNFPIPRAGGHETGTTTLGALAAWMDAHIQGLSDEDAAIAAALAKFAAQMDPKALAASLAAAVEPTIAEAVKAGIAPAADQLALTFEQHLAATLAAPK